MGIVNDVRGKGAGSWFMERIIHEARERADHEMLLEVIEQNDAAVRLYEKFGFESMRRLIGFIRKEAVELEPDDVQEVDVREVGLLIAQYGLHDLPWQLTGETISQMVPPTRAYCKDKAYIVISNPEAEHVVIWSLLVEPEARGKHFGKRLLKTVMANHPQKTWHIPAIYPEELGTVFEKAGFEREELSQWQMRLTLNALA
jgi:ribosomal protein S18 acetylase RimI-like enzyme